MPTAAPEKPTDVNVKAINNDNVTLTWKKPKQDGGSKVTGFRILMQEDGGEWKEIAKLKSIDDDYKVGSLGFTATLRLLYICSVATCQSNIPNLGSIVNNKML